MKIILQLLLISLFIGCKKHQAPLDPRPGVIHENILAKGVNLSNWFNDYSDPSQVIF